MPNKKNKRANLFMTVLLLSASICQATDIFDLDLETLSQIRVSQVASSFPVSDLDVGSTVSVIERDDWHRIGARRWSEALQHVPGLMVYPTLGGSDALAIRGYAQSLSVRGIATLIDGVPVNTLSYGTGQYSTSLLGINTLDRIELIRGPGSSLYGSDAFHGVVSGTTYASDSNESLLGARFDEHGFMQWWGRSSQAMHGKHRVHLSAEYRDQPDQKQAYHFRPPGEDELQRGIRANAYETTTGNIKFTGHLDQQTHYRLGFLYNDFESQRFQGTGRELFGGLDLNRDRDWSDGNGRTRMAHGKIEHQLPNGIIVSGMLYWWKKNVYFDFDQTIVLDRVLRLDQTESRRGGEIRVKQRNKALRTDWEVGVQHAHFDIERAQNMVFSPEGELRANLASPFNEQTRDIRSVTLQASTRLLNDKISLLYGGRIDHYSEFGTEMSPRLGLIYQPDSRSAWKLLYGNAFRAAVAGELNASGNIDGNPSIRPEQIDTYELVYINHLVDSVRLEAVAFMSRWRDAIGVAPHPDPDSGFESRYTNRGKLSAYGAEGQASYRSAQGWINTSITYTRSKDENREFDFTAFPEWIATLDVGFNLSEQSSIGLTQRAHINASESSTPLAHAVKNDLRHYWRTDLIWRQSIGKQVLAQLEIRNLYNRTNYLPALWNMSSGIPDRKRSIQASVEWQM